MIDWKTVESNEVEWWSRWVKVVWLGRESYVLLSSDMDESFFNRAGFVDCEVGFDAISNMESAFEGAGRTPLWTVRVECDELLKALSTRGYDEYDEMSVMQLIRPGFREASGLRVVQGEDVDAEEWAATYLLSFYGDLALGRVVGGIVAKIAHEPSVTLLGGEQDGKMAGVLAAFRTSGLLGVYCVGTLSECRGRGVAGSLIRRASEIASSEGRSLVLQTIVSDGVEGFYARGGFERLYSKRMMKRKGEAGQ